MSVFKCPGSDLIRDPRPEVIPCPGCGVGVELWSDEEETACPRCGGAVYKKMPPSCWEWCAFARECIGPEKYDRLSKKRKEAGKPKDKKHQENTKTGKDI